MPGLRLLACSNVSGAQRRRRTGALRRPGARGQSVPMRYSEKENFRRVIQWDSPSHVCYPPPSRSLSYHGAWPVDSRPSTKTKQWRDIWGVTWTDLDGEVFPTAAAIASIDELGQLAAPDPHAPGRFDKVRREIEQIARDAYFVSANHPYFLYEKGFNLLGAEEFLVSLAADPPAAERLVLCGGIDGQRVLPLGTPADVREEVARKMALLWEGGGYLPMAEKMLGVPPANREAMEQAIREWNPHDRALPSRQ